MYACEEQSKAAPETSAQEEEKEGGFKEVLRKSHSFLNADSKLRTRKSSFFISAALAASSPIRISDLPPLPKSMSAAAAPGPPSSDPSAHPPDPSPIGTKTLESHGSDEKPGSDPDRAETDAGGGGGGGEAAEEEEEEEEEGECGFCLFMKGGGCRDAFVDWEKCIEEAEKSKEDIVDKCYRATAALKKCMEAHPDYYEPILRAEKAAEEEAVKELEREAAAKDAARSSSAEPAPGERTETLEVANE